MRRRDFIATLTGAAIAAPRIALAQAEQTRRIAIFWSGSSDDRQDMAILAANVAELERLGWREGANLRVDRRCDAQGRDLVIGDPSEAGMAEALSSNVGRSKDGGGGKA